MTAKLTGHLTARGKVKLSAKVNPSPTAKLQPKVAAILVRSGKIFLSLKAIPKLKELPPAKVLPILTRTGLVPPLRKVLMPVL